MPRAWLENGRLTTSINPFSQKLFGSSAMKGSTVAKPTPHNTSKRLRDLSTSKYWGATNSR